MVQVLITALCTLCVVLGKTRMSRRWYAPALLDLEAALGLHLEPSLLNSLSSCQSPTVFLSRIPWVKVLDTSLPENDCCVLMTAIGSGPWLLLQPHPTCPVCQHHSLTLEAHTGLSLECCPCTLLLQEWALLHLLPEEALADRPILFLPKANLSWALQICDHCSKLQCQATGLASPCCYQFPRQCPLSC